MVYFGILLAFVYIWIGFKVAFEPRPAGSVVYRNLFKVMAMGVIHGFCLLVATVGPFVWLGASLPAVQIMGIIMVASAVAMILLCWKPVVEAINRGHGVATSTFIVV